MVSIIVPVYNVEKYLPRCIESILNQLYKDFELILVDDGSSDKSGFICDYYAQKDSRIKVIHKSNEGVSSARNVGIDAAKGEYISFIDGDDWINELFLLKLTDEMMHNDIELAICNIEYRALKVSCSNCNMNGVLEFSKLNVEDYLYFFNHTIGCISCGRLYLSKIIKEHIRFNKNIKIAEDTLFMQEYMFFCHKICIIEDRMYYYNTFRDSSSRKQLYGDFFDWNLIIGEKLEKNVEKLKISEGDKKKIISQIMLARFISNIKMGIECDSKENFNKTLEKYMDKFDKWLFLDTTWRDIQDNLHPVRNAVYNKNIESIYVEQRKLLDIVVLKNLVRKILVKFFMTGIERKRDGLVNYKVQSS